MGSERPLGDPDARRATSSSPADLRGYRRAQRHDGRRALARAPGSSVSNGPITYELDGTQYILVGAGDTLWAFAMQHDERKSTSGIK